jgi:hypothetical protein
MSLYYRGRFDASQLRLSCNKSENAGRPWICKLADAIQPQLMNLLMLSAAADGLVHALQPQLMNLLCQGSYFGITCSELNCNTAFSSCKQQDN